MDYQIESKKLRNEKVILATVDSAKQAKIFTLDGLNYKRTEDFMVIGIKVNGSVINPYPNTTLPLNRWHFDAQSMQLYIRLAYNPKNYTIAVIYRHFFSNAPLILPYNISSGGVEVPWLPLIGSIGAIGEQLDDQNTGIVLESSSSIKLINRDGYFDSIFDTHIWENQAATFYSWFPSTSTDEVQYLFDGVVESKEFAEDSIGFKIKDNIYKLRNKVQLGEFSDLDGTILPSMIGKSKRRIYGMADSVKTVSTDAILSGFNLNGTTSGNITTKTITGAGTAFLSEVCPGDELFYTVGTTEYKTGVATVDSDTQITTSKDIEASFSSATLKIKPKTPYYKKNRTWNLSGAQLYEASAPISSVISSNAFQIPNTNDFYTGDEIKVNGIQTTVRRISGNLLITSTNIVPTPPSGALITKRAVREVYYKSTKLVFERDYTYSNSGECIIELKDGSVAGEYPAEFNCIEPKFLNIDLDFHNGTRSVTTVDPVDLRTVLKSRDWIKANNVAFSNYYEVLDVYEHEIILRKNFAYSSGKLHAYIKTPEYVDENSQITVDCIGIDDTGIWAKTAADAVKHLLLGDSQFFTVNDQSFIDANADCDYILSLVIPENLGDDAPLVRDIITKINESVFGSLYNSRASGISYSILNSEKPEISEIIKDDDILGFSVSTEQKIINEAKVNYRQFIDIYSGESALKTISVVSSFVNNFIGINNKLEKTMNIYEDSKAEIMAYRICLFNSLSRATITIRAKLNLALMSINDKVYIELDRLFKRFSNTQKQKICTISGIKRDGYNTELILNDMGNIFNRVPSIAPDSTLDYTNASDSDKLKWGFILDNLTETPDNTNESGLGSNIIG